jgi:hypothetical protein
MLQLPKKVQFRLGQMAAKGLSEHHFLIVGTAHAFIRSRDIRGGKSGVGGCE